MKHRVSLLIALLLLLAPILTAGEPDFRNPNPVFKPLTPEQQDAWLKKRLGEPPVLSGKERARIEKGEILVREKPSSGEGKRFEAVAQIQAPPEAVMAYLKQFDKFVGVMPHLESIDFKWNGNLAVVTQRIKVMLSRFWYTLNILHCKNSMIEWEFIEGSIKDTSGYYKFFPLPHGRTLIVYHIYTDPGIACPRFIMDLLTKHSMPDVIEAVRKAVEKPEAQGHQKQTHRSLEK